MFLSLVPSKPAQIDYSSKSSGYGRLRGISRRAIVLKHVPLLQRNEQFVPVIICITRQKANSVIHFCVALSPVMINGKLIHLQLLRVLFFFFLHFPPFLLHHTSSIMFSDVFTVSVTATSTNLTACHDHNLLSFPGSQFNTLYLCTCLLPLASDHRVIRQCLYIYGRWVCSFRLRYGPLCHRRACRNMLFWPCFRFLN